MKNLILIAIAIIISISTSAFAQTLPQVIDPNNLPSNVVIIKDSISFININEGAGIAAVHHPSYRIFPQDFNQKVEITYSKMYSNWTGDTITIQHTIWKCDPNYSFNNESTLPQTVVPGKNAVIWKEEKSFLPLGDNGDGPAFEVINTDTYKMYEPIK